MNVYAKDPSFESIAGEGEKVVQIAQKISMKKYRLIIIPSRPAVFMIIINALFSSTILGVNIDSAKSQFPSIGKSIFLDNTLLIVALLFGPFIGWLSDSYFGRYKILTTSLYLWLLSIVFMALDVIFLSRILYGLYITTLLLSLGCFVPCIIPFTIDQFVGSSGEQLSFIIYWIVWAWAIYASGFDIFVCFPSVQYQLHQTVSFFLISLSLVLAYVLIHCCDHTLMTKPQLSNPVKLVVQVLNYARKHKFPERRSAFTYWEDECPSRIDLGKEKYGGPFTVEEVENVKTVFKLIPLIVCIIGAVFADKTILHTYYDVHSCEIKNARFYYPMVQIVVSVSWLPVYHFLIYPLFYNCVPSMLRRIGIGICFIASSQLFTSVMYFMFTDVFKVSDATVTKSQSEAPFLSEWFVLSSYLVRDVSKIIVCSVSLEFCMAQAPCQVRGLVTSVILSTGGIFSILYVDIQHYVRTQWVLYTVNCVASLAFLVIFVFVSKWYKLRKRDDVIPYHLFAEDEFESRPWRSRFMAYVLWLCSLIT